jgi:aspartyl-tRNA synthetase
MYRTHTCGELRTNHIAQSVTLSGWVQRMRELGGMVFIDLRDRYGITQLVAASDSNPDLVSQARNLGREFVIQITGNVQAREKVNNNLPTGEVEVHIQEIKILNAAQTPPFTIEEQSDGGDELRMRYRYLDLRRPPLKRNLELRHKMGLEVRNYLDNQNFLEIETPFLIKSTPEGARDFVVPSRMNPGEFYALPQSPQTFKQLLMVAGYDRYFQIVRCFRDEDLRADRQPEFTQIDCEMAFVEREDILNTFEGLTRHLFKTILNQDPGEFPRITYDQAMENYGSDKPDIRFDMTFVDLTESAKGNNFPVFDQAEYVAAICVPNAAEYTRKQLDELTDWVKRPQIGATGLIYARFLNDGTLKSSVDKFFNAEDLEIWMKKANAKPGDLLLILAGKTDKTRKQLGELRLEMGNRLGLRNPEVYKPLWVLDFPLLEFDEDSNRWYAMHHPFTAPYNTDVKALAENPGAARANAYDLVLNGTEIAGGSIRIHNRELQSQLFDLLQFSKEEAEAQFGFLLSSFTYGAPPHGGIAFGFDRLCALFGGADSIRDFIAFPKNNAGKDTMIQAPEKLHQNQLNELNLILKQP